MFTNDTLEGHAASIAGGGSVLGMEIATAYWRLGTSVISVKEERVQSAAAKCDVRNYDEVKAANEAQVQRFGALDIALPVVA